MDLFKTISLIKNMDVFVDCLKDLSSTRLMDSCNISSEVNACFPHLQARRSDKNYQILGSM